MELNDLVTRHRNTAEKTAILSILSIIRSMQAKKLVYFTPIKSAPLYTTLVKRNFCAIL